MSDSLLAESPLSSKEHQDLDNEIIHQFPYVLQNCEEFPNSEVALATLVQLIVARTPPKANLRKSSPEAYLKILKNQQILDIVKDAICSRTFRNVRNLIALRSLPVDIVMGEYNDINNYHDDDGRSATLRSWDSGENPFIGKAHEALYAMISTVCASGQRIYARSLSVVQSSGMGKSRMIDELSKEHFVIPINLRTKGTGFPPGDRAVSEFLVNAPFTQKNASFRATAFSISLFETTAKIIPALDYELRKIDSKEPHPTSTAQKFRLFMSFGQTFSHSGQLRQNFYHDVINRAKAIIELAVDDGSKQKKDIESEDVPMDTNNSSGMVKDGRIKSEGSPVLNFIENKKPLSLYATAVGLIRVLAPDWSLQSEPPLIILAYDEAHELNFCKAENLNPRAPTAYSEHRKVIRGMRELPIFALFLSTTGKVQDLTSPPNFLDPSDRLYNKACHSLAPFSALGFDQMIKAHEFTADYQNFGINDVSKVEFMVLFGRPLWGSRYKHGSSFDKNDIVHFAKQKLIYGDLENPSSSAKLALMSVRLALEFNAQTTAAHADEMEQVKKHMRILVHQGFETAVTISPSEPLLAEASRQYMTDHTSSFSMPTSLLEHLTTMGLDKGDRGELAAQVILILAADKACKEAMGAAAREGHSTQASPRAFSVEQFIKVLFNKQWHNNILCSLPARWRTKTDAKHTFQTAFKDTRIYLTHFVKLDHSDVVNREFVWRLVIRGCAALCANGQCGIDIIIPLVFGTGILCRSNVSALFVHKNDKRFKAQPDSLLFDYMNPYPVGFFDSMEEEPLPIIRMVFAFGSPTAALKIIPQPYVGKARAAKTGTFQKSSAYTSYDMWCSKPSSETFGVIEAGDEKNYELLLKTRKVFPQAYKSEIEDIKSIKQSMNPATSVEGEHWTYMPFLHHDTQLTVADNEEDDGVEE